jgi:dephospho-CoA kinase
MKIIGLTGGIGSGKTTIAKMFNELGVPVYNSDLEAKILMKENEKVKKKIIALIGNEAYSGNELNNKFIAVKVFNNEELLKKLNRIVHPAVKADFKEWAKKHEAPYVIQEAAILFENGSYKDFDDMILVTAPKKHRISRIMKRDGTSKKAILERMQHQWPDKKKKELAGFIIKNDTLQETFLQVEEIHRQLIKKYT